MRKLFIIPAILFLMVSTVHAQKKKVKPDAGSLTGAGMEQFADEDLDSAIQLYGEAISVDSLYQEAYYRRADAYYQEDSFARAINDYEWLVNHHTKKADVYKRLGDIDTLSKDYKDAVLWYNTALLIDSGQGSYFAARGMSMFYLGNYSKATNDLSEAVNLNYTSADIYSKLGYAYLNTDDNGQAVFYFTKAIEMNPLNYYDYANRGDALVAMHQLDAAKADLYFYMKFDKKDYSVWYNLARAQYGLNEYDSAIASYQVVIQLKPGYGDTYFRMGLTYADKGDYGNAKGSFTQAIGEYPNDAYLYFNRAVAIEKMANGADYCADLKKASDMGYYQAQVMYSRVCGQ